MRLLFERDLTPHPQVLCLTEVCLEVSSATCHVTSTVDPGTPSPLPPSSTLRFTSGCKRSTRPPRCCTLGCTAQSSGSLALRLATPVSRGATRSLETSQTCMPSMPQLVPVAKTPSASSGGPQSQGTEAWCSRGLRRYVYACNNPSESIIAKRRGYGTIVSHNVPPYGRAGLYKQMATLRELLAEYREDPEVQVPDEKIVRDQCHGKEPTRIAAGRCENDLSGRLSG